MGTDIATSSKAEGIGGGERAPLRPGPGSVLAFALAAAPVYAWQAKQAKLMTPWASQVGPANAWPEYPRPQMRRTDWLNLNGLWQFQRAANGNEPLPAGKLSGEILVPFPIEAALSGVMETGVTYAWYRRPFTVPAAWLGGGNRILLHFQAVDNQAEVFVNGKSVSTHKGGYDYFTVDITPALKNGGSGDQDLAVRVYDPTNSHEGENVVGKQRLNPGGAFYTACTGIWQTVWLEPVPAEASVRRLVIVPDVDGQDVKVKVELAGDTAGAKLYGLARDGGRGMFGLDSAAAGAGALDIKLSAVNLWYPDRPYLYGLGVYLKKGGRLVDSVKSYFALRKVEAVKGNGPRQIRLNGQVCFHFAPLDQGYWPDGIYTPPSYAAMRYDLTATKSFGFNCTRKHVKVEPELWYWLCDSLGLSVWQDMPSLDTQASIPGGQNFSREFDSLIAQKRNHPCVTSWIIFNEGWGEHDPKVYANRIMATDPGRLINSGSGSFADIGDILDEHSYPWPACPDATKGYATVAGEFGGLEYAIDGHHWDSPFGYQDEADEAAFLKDFAALAKELANCKSKTGLSGAVYTQITDVENETNGLLTYDRLYKVDSSKIAAVVRPFLDPASIAAPAAPRDSVPAAFRGLVTSLYRNRKSTAGPVARPGAGRADALGRARAPARGGPSAFPRAGGPGAAATR